MPESLTDEQKKTLASALLLGVITDMMASADLEELAIGYEGLSEEDVDDDDFREIIQLADTAVVQMQIGWRATEPKEDLDADE